MCTADVQLWAYLQDVYFPQSSVQSAESRTDYQVQVGQFLKWWLATCQPYRPATIADLTRATIQECRSWKAQARTVATANHLKRVLTALCNHAAEAGIVPFPGRIRNLKEPQREPRAWRLDEYARILATAGDMPGEHGGVALSVLLPAFYRFAYDSGARIDTLMSTRWTWFALSDAECIIPAERTKDQQEMVIELSRATVDAMVQLRVSCMRGTASDLVFGRWREAAFRRMHKRIVYAALVDPTCDVGNLVGKARAKAEAAVGRLDCFHKIRRTTATEITAVAGEAVACKALGHSSVQVTRRYLDKRRLKQTVQANQRPEIPEAPPLRVLKME